MSKPKMKVIVIGAGFTGPVVAMLLKHKGFDPIIYERHAALPTGGLAMQLSGQVLKVLNILGLADEVITLTQPLQRVHHLSELTGRVLLDAPVYDQIRETTGWPICTIVRTTFAKFLIENATKRGIPVHWGKMLVDVKQEGDKVTAVFEDNTTDEGDLLVGCDGLHSKVRDALFGKSGAEYTGAALVGGFTPFSDTMCPSPPYTGMQVSGEGCHFVCFPTSEGTYMWALIIRGEGEMKEDWRTASPEKVSDMLASLPSANWGGDAGKIIRSTAQVVRFGFYLRPIPEVWYKGRAVLVGDAAHPTAPFLGQGANQSAEDIYHLVRMLVRHEPLTNESLEEALREYTTIRRTRVVRTIEQTKKEGAGRIAKTKEDLMAREAEQAKGLESATWKVILEMVQGPFAGESEI